MSAAKFIVVAVVLFEYFGSIESGSILKDVKFDENCPLDLVVHDIRLTDCDKLPCNIKRGKRYYIEGDFSVLRNVSHIVLKCSTIYLGRHFELPGHGGCENLVEPDCCPVVVGTNYTSATSFKIPYYVPRMLYTVYCSMVDDKDENMMCGWGSGRVV